jgi:uncharacterized protein involved in type VI secretion and phage assembly
MFAQLHRFKGDRRMSLLTGPAAYGHEADGWVQGVAVALVVQNCDEARLGRVKVSFPWASDPRESSWARIAVPMTGIDHGTLLLPEVGSELLVAFDHGDPGHPYIVGGLWNGQERPPETNEGRNGCYVIRSRKGHEIVVDSSKDKIELKLNDSERLLLGDDGVGLEDSSGNRLAITTEEGDLTIEAKSKITPKAQAIALRAGTLELEASGDLAIRGGLVRIN